MGGGGGGRGCVDISRSGCSLNVDTVPVRGSGDSEVKLCHKIKPLLQNVHFRLHRLPFWYPFGV